MALSAAAWSVVALAVVAACASERARVASSAPGFDPGPVPPELAEGAESFAAFCSGCHGDKGAGFEGGPPLLHPRYLPEVFPDASIRRAILAGSPARHWTFEAMPPIRALPLDHIPAVIGYLRWVQTRWTARPAS